MSKPRKVLSLRLSDDEKNAIASAAATQRITPSEFLRQAALLVAHRLAEAAKPKPRPFAVRKRSGVPGPIDEPHVFRTWTGEAYLAHRRGGFGSGGFMHDPARYGGDPMEEA